MSKQDTSATTSALITVNTNVLVGSTAVYVEDRMSKQRAFIASDDKIDVAIIKGIEGLQFLQKQLEKLLQDHRKAVESK